MGPPVSPGKDKDGVSPGATGTGLMGSWGDVGGLNEAVTARLRTGSGPAESVTMRDRTGLIGDAWYHSYVQPTAHRSA
jgi:hypothetical protein